MQRQPSRAKKLLAKFLLVLMGVFVGAVIAEIALRVAGYSFPEFYRRDEVAGFSLMPGAEGWYRKEGNAHVRINSDGLRDVEHALTKPQGTFRIAVLGDSYCEALQVSQEEAFWNVMAIKLNECQAFPGKVEVINFGVSGYGTAEELLTLREKVWKYSPDLVVLAVTTNNDVTDNSRALKKTDDVPYFVYQDGQLTLDSSFRASRSFRFGNSWLGRFGHWWRTHFRLIEAVVQGHRGFKALLASRRAKSSASPPPQTETSTPENPDLFMRAEELGADNLVYLEPNNAVWNDAWRVTEGLIAQMRDEVAQHQAKFLVVTLSNGPQVIPDPKWREAFAKRLGVTDLLYPDTRIKAFGAREGIPVVNLAPDLQSFADNNKTFLHGFGENIGNGHWNATGHRVAGELLAKKICAGALLK
jgi:hypothetical protein